MNRNTRIQLQDSTMNVVTKMSEGNPGAINVIMLLLTRAGTIDKNDAMGGIGKVLLLDTFGIYGTDIYVFYSDICGSDLVKMVAVLRATQMGLFSSSILKDACHRQDYSGRDMVPVEELYNKVKEQLPLFGMPEPEVIN